MNYVTGHGLDRVQWLPFTEHIEENYKNASIGPFIPHKDTPFANQPAGTLDLTLRLLSIIRLIHPHVLLPATTALGTIDPKGREKGILAGGNVVIGTYILFQETYHKESYEKLHPTGPKHNYAYHTEAMDRAMEGGIDDVGIGVLFGLNTYR